LPSNLKCLRCLGSDSFEEAADKLLAYVTAKKGDFLIAIEAVLPVAETVGQENGDSIEDNGDIIDDNGYNYL
jgi:hypothetical protein